MYLSISTIYSSNTFVSLKFYDSDKRLVLLIAVTVKHC